MARQVRSDAERAADELKVYEQRLERAAHVRDAARTAYAEAQADYDRTLAVRNHLRSHPALSDNTISLVPKVEVEA